MSVKIETYRMTKVKICLIKYKDYEELFFLPLDVGIAILVCLRPLISQRKLQEEEHTWGRGGGGGGGEEATSDRILFLCKHVSFVVTFFLFFPLFFFLFGYIISFIYFMVFPFLLSCFS